MHNLLVHMDLATVLHGQDQQEYGEGVSQHTGLSLAMNLTY